MAGSIMAGQTTNYLFDYPTSTDYVKDGATAIETLADDVDATLFTALGGAYPGLRLIKKQTIGSAVASVTVTGAFSATYDNYKIVISGGTPSASAFTRLTLGSTATGYYSGYVGATFASVVQLAGDNNANFFGFASYADNNFGHSCNVDLFNPFATSRTTMNSNVITATNSLSGQGQLANNTSYTAFTITASSGTFTGGTIYVYGYGAS